MTDAPHPPAPRVPISFEFFPPNTPVGSEKLKTVVRELAAVQPEFFSVTYGAGGSTREKTLATVRDIAALAHLDILAVLSGTAKITYEAKIEEVASDKHTQVIESNVGNP